MSEGGPEAGNGQDGISVNTEETGKDQEDHSGAAAEDSRDGISDDDSEAGNGQDGLSGDGAGRQESVSDNAVENDAHTGESRKEPAKADSGVKDGSQSGDSLSVQRREPVKVKGIYVSGPVAGIAKMDTLIDLVDRTELNAMVIDIKNDEGRVTYKMQSGQVLEIEAGVRYISDIQELVAKCKEKDIYLIARIVAFRDPYLAEKKPEWAVHTRDGSIFRDKSGLAWVNPYQREVWDYLVEIASEAAKEGFDEIQFDYIRFSTDLKEDEVDYGEESAETDKIEIITEFTQYLYDRLVPLGVYVAADVFGTVIDNETDQAIVGQDYVKMAAHLDYICPMVYPSHYHNGAYGISIPDAEPYRTIYEASASSVRELAALPEEKRAQARMWLQGFTAGWVPGHISYGPEQIRAQIKGAYDAGYEEWILWNAAVNYQPELFLTEEQAEAERLQWEAERQAQVTEEESAVTKPEEGVAEETERQKQAVTEESEVTKSGEAMAQETEQMQ
ncbi:MAG: putative glycoside hydrolase [Lachnospiraceae bacterium]|nr:putative glycoside hydrolase [Lachnospiraceae bacterium]